MSDAPRIDLAQARATGLPTRSPDDATARFVALLPSSAPPATAPTPDTPFSPLALLLARFLPADGSPPPTPTPDEARLLHAWLQQRAVSVLRDAGATVPPDLGITIAGDGRVRATSTSPMRDRLPALIERDPDIARLALVLRDVPSANAAAIASMGARARGQSERMTSRNTVSHAHRAWPWPWRSDGDDDRRSVLHSPTATMVAAVACAALLLAWWLAA